MGLPVFAAATRRRKFWALRAPIWSTSAVFRDEVRVVLAQEFGDNLEAGFFFGKTEETEALLAQALELVGAGARFVRTAAQEGGPPRP